MPITGKNLSLYFHIPFCRKKCPYCHFYSAYYTKDLMNKYLVAVKKQIDLYKKYFANRNIVSIYFGGGTPSIIGNTAIEAILLSLDIDLKNIEITIEANPEDVSLKKMQNFKKIGINRISLGVQSFDNSLLKLLKRNHNKKDILKSIDDIYLSGINNISIDLMYDIPHQSLQVFENTLNTLTNLPITHLSIYNLTFEKNTQFFKEKEKYLPFIPKDKLSIQMLDLLTEKLKNMKFQRYEISAFAKNNKISQHNIGYWQAREFLGFGPSAFSYFEKKRFSIVKSISKYIAAINNNSSFINYSEKLEYPDNIHELLLINLRIIEGINLNTFQKNHGKIPQKTLETLKHSEFINFTNERICLSKKGLLFYDSLAEIIV